MVGNKIKLNPKIKVIILLAIFIIVFVVLCVVYFVDNNKKTDVTKNDKSTTNTYIDPGSGETVIDPPGKAKEKTDSVNSITYLGFTDLLDHGITYKQFLKLKSHFKQYSIAKKIDIKEVSITLSTYKSKFDQSAGETVMNFEITINRKSKYDAKVTYSGLDMPILYLYEKNSPNLVFKSYTGGN